MLRPTPPPVPRTGLLAARSRPVLSLVVVLCVMALLAGCTPTATPGSPVAKKSPKPAATPTSTPTPASTTPSTPAPLSVSEPFETTIQQVRVATADNHAMFGRAPVNPDPTAANQAAEAAADALDRFLNAQFVDPETRLSEAGVAALIDPNTLDEGTRAALGVMAVDDVLGTRAGSSWATADVVIAGAALEVVTLTYRATVDLVLAEVEGTVSHSGVVVFIPAGGQLIVTAVHPTTTVSDPLAGAMS